MGTAVTIIIVTIISGKQRNDQVEINNVLARNNQAGPRIDFKAAATPKAQGKMQGIHVKSETHASRKAAEQRRETEKAKKEKQQAEISCSSSC